MQVCLCSFIEVGGSKALRGSELLNICNAAWQGQIKRSAGKFCNARFIVQVVFMNDKLVFIDVPQRPFRPPLGAQAV